MIVTGAYLAAEPIYASGSARWSRPYRDKTTNQGIVALGVLIFCAGVTSEMIVWYPKTHVTRVAQVLFGVAAMLVVVVTLFVLTPIGEPFARAWIRCTVEDKQQSKSNVVVTKKDSDVENPLGVQ